LKKINTYLELVTIGSYSKQIKPILKIKTPFLTQFLLK